MVFIVNIITVVVIFSTDAIFDDRNIESFELGKTLFTYFVLIVLIQLIIAFATIKKAKKICYVIGVMRMGSFIVDSYNSYSRQLYQ